MAALFSTHFVSAVELQAESMLSLRSGVEASSTVASQISVAEAERMMKDTTMFTKSVHKKSFYVFGYECPDEAKWIILGMLAAIWIAGFILFLTCVCCKCNCYGRYDRENGLEAFRDKLEKSKKSKEDEEAAPMMDDM